MKTPKELGYHRLTIYTNLYKDSQLFQFRQFTAQKEIILTSSSDAGDIETEIVIPEGYRVLLIDSVTAYKYYGAITSSEITRVVGLWVKKCNYLSFEELVNVYFNKGYQVTYLELNDTDYLGVWNPAERKGIVFLPVNKNVYSGVTLVEYVDSGDSSSHLYPPHLFPYFDKNCFKEAGYTIVDGYTIV